MSDTKTKTKTKLTNDEARCEAFGLGIEKVGKLYDRLTDLHRICGREVEYVTASGSVEKYHPNRYLQGLRRAGDLGDVIGYCERIVLAESPSFGFNVLRVANRLDLTVEAQLLDPEFAPLFLDPAIREATDRLALAAIKRRVL